ncbi:MAG: septum formation initiator family protein [bacterium]
MGLFNLKKRNIKIKGIFIVLVGFLCVFLISLAKEAYRNYKINKEIKDLRNKIEVLENENMELSSLVNYLKTDNFAEKEARLKLGLKKEGEKVFNIEKLAGADHPSLNILKSADESNIKKWQKLFFASP